MSRYYSSSKASPKPGFPCFEPRCQRHNDPYRTKSGLQKHLEAVLRYFPDRQSKRGEEARNHHILQVLQELKLDTPDIIEQKNNVWSVANKWLRDDNGEEEYPEYEDQENEDQGYSEGEDDKYAEDEDGEYVEEDEVEAEDGEVVQVISQRYLRATEATGSTSSGRQNNYKRRAEEPSMSYPRTYRQHLPNELNDTPEGLDVDYIGHSKKHSIEDGWKTRGAGRSDCAKPMETGKRDTGRMAEPGRQNMRLKLTPGAADTGNRQVLQRVPTVIDTVPHTPTLQNPTTSSRCHDPVASDSKTPSYRLRIYTHHNFLRVGDGCRILNTAKYPTYAAISVAILSGLQRGSNIYTEEPCNWKIAGLTVVGRLSGSTGKEKFVVRDEEDWKTVTENVLSVEAAGELIEVQVALETK